MDDIERSEDILEIAIYDSNYFWRFVEFIEIFFVLDVVDTIIQGVATFVCYPETLRAIENTDTEMYVLEFFHLSHN